MARRRLRPKSIDNLVARPHCVVVAQSVNNIIAPLFLPSLNVFRRDKSSHVHMTTGAALATGNVSTLLHGSLGDTTGDTISATVKGELFLCPVSRGRLHHYSWIIEGRHPSFYSPALRAAPHWKSRFFPCHFLSETAIAAKTEALPPDLPMDCPMRTANVLRDVP
ncbi:MAG: hypothetical protein A4E65_03581 [Syntrophorhabdus sp. PtaU1.Bin153]|nr:MAG: hypothetical protein A4E65_03581 [Syntrophorhabdus sp. PtaU1.Bin153]